MPTPPSTPPRKRLTRDQRRDILLLRRQGHTYQYIADFLHVSHGAVQYTCKKRQATPQHKNAGRPPRLSNEEADKVEEFVTRSKATRRMTYLQIAEALWPEGEVGAESVRYALHKRGYRRRFALRKPPISERNRIARLEWAREHIHWTEEQWYQVLWSDETWVTGGRHRRTLITQKPGEELLPDCVVERIPRPSGWMFWACFAGDIKGPSLFWEKEWGSINTASYIEHIVPLVDGWIHLNSHLRFMQDNAPAHASRETKAELAARGIQSIVWPAYSPDLNPIETVWNEMKDWIALHYPEKTTSYQQLRRQVMEAWNAIGRDLLRNLVATMPQRCRDVIEADGKHTKW
jgi:transposase